MVALVSCCCYFGVVLVWFSHCIVVLVWCDVDAVLVCCDVGVVLVWFWCGFSILIMFC